MAGNRRTEPAEYHDAFCWKPGRRAAGDLTYWLGIGPTAACCFRGCFIGARVILLVGVAAMRWRDDRQRLPGSSQGTTAAGRMT